MIRRVMTNERSFTGQALFETLLLKRLSPFTGPEAANSVAALLPQVLPSSVGVIVCAAALMVRVPGAEEMVRFRACGAGCPDLDSTTDSANRSRKLGRR